MYRNAAQVIGPVFGGSGGLEGFKMCGTSNSKDCTVEAPCARTHFLGVLLRTFMDRPFGGFRWQKRGVSVLGLRFGSAHVRDVLFMETKIFSETRNLTARWRVWIEPYILDFHGEHYKPEHLGRDRSETQLGRKRA